MGDACVLEGKGNSDVIRAHCSEAVSVRSEWDDTVSVKLRQLVMSFVMADTHLLDTQRLPSLETALATVMNEDHLAPRVLVTLLALPTQGETATRLIRWIWDDTSARRLFQQALADRLVLWSPPADARGFTEAWLVAAEQDRNRLK